MNIIITGATGMAGAEVVRQAIADKHISQITAIVRKPLDIQDSKLKTIIHADFTNYSTLTEIFMQANACLWCLGISQTQVSKQVYETITYDYTLAAAKAMLIANPGIVFMFLSGEGADVTEKSSSIFARVKGKTENALLKLGFKHLYIARPGGINPVHKNKNTALMNKLVIPFFPLLELLFPSMVITSDVLAKAMLHIVKNKLDNHLYRNNQLKEIGKNISL